MSKKVEVDLETRQSRFDSDGIKSFQIVEPVLVLKSDYPPPEHQKGFYAGDPVVRKVLLKANEALLDKFVFDQQGQEPFPSPILTREISPEGKKFVAALKNFFEGFRPRKGLLTRLLG